MADQHYESGMGGSQGQGAPGNEYGMGSRNTDQGVFRNEEGMGAGQISDQGATSRGNEYGVGNERQDIARDPEEGMGAGQESQGNAGNEYGMGSGRPANEQGMGVIPGHDKHHEGKQGGQKEGLMDKVKDVFKKH